MPNMRASLGRRSQIIYLGAFMLFSGVLISYFVLFLRPKFAADQEKILTSQLGEIAVELNSLSRERENLSISLARKGEFLHAVVRSPVGGAFKSKEEEERFIGKFLSKEVEAFPFIEGAGLFFEPRAFNPNEQLRGFYARWVPPLGMNRKVEFTMARSTEQANYLNSGWYRSLIPSGWDSKRHLYADVTWTDPYREPVSLVPMISVLVAMYGEDSSLIGLSSVDWNLDQLTETIDRSRPTRSSIAALFSPNTKEFAAVAGLQGLNLQPIDRAKWMPQVLFNAPTDRYEMVNGKNDEGLPYRVYTRTLENGLIYSLVIPESEIFSGLWQLDQQQIILFLFALFVSSGGLLYLFKRQFSHLSNLCRVAESYAAGDFSKSIEIKSGDELEFLAKCHSRYKSYVESLRARVKALAAGERREVSDDLAPSDKASLNLDALEHSIQSIQQQIESLSDHISKGETATRLDEHNFNGAWKHTARSINTIVDTFDKLVSESISLFSQAYKGEFSSRIHGSRAGVFESYRQGINIFLDKHDEISRDKSRTIEALRIARDESQLGVRAKTQLIRHLCEEVPGILKQTFSTLSTLPLHTASSKQNAAIDRIKVSCTKMLGVFDQISCFQYVEEGRIEVCNSEFNLHFLLFDLKDRLRLDTIRRRQELSLVLDADIPELVLGDGGLLRNILFDIGGQAVRSSDEGGSITIRASLVENTAESYTLKFTISDTGGSAYEANRHLIYDLIQKGATEQAALSKGGGFSLVVAMRLAELMGGSLTFDLAPGFGAQTHLKIPLLHSKYKTALTEAAKDPREEHKESSLAHEPAVLVVEDDLVSQKVISHILKRQGCRPIIVGDGQEALYALDNQHFDIVLMDITLPIMDGIEATRRIRNSGKDYSTIPIIAVTAHALRLREEPAVSNGFNAFLLKPLESKALKQVLNLFDIGKKDPALSSLPQSVIQ